MSFGVFAPSDFDIIWASNHLNMSVLDGGYIEMCLAN